MVQFIPFVIIFIILIFIFVYSQNNSDDLHSKVIAAQNEAKIANEKASTLLTEYQNFLSKK